MIIEVWRFRFTLAALVVVVAGCAPQSPIESGDKSIMVTHHEIGAAARIAERMAAERRRVRAWWGVGFDGPIRVEISDRQRVAMALVPAWRGDRGKMLLPIRTIVSGTTPTLHELVHIEAPNGNRFLAEGLAVYLQTRLGGVSEFR